MEPASAFTTGGTRCQRLKFTRHQIKTFATIKFDYRNMLDIVRRTSSHNVDNPFTTGKFYFEFQGVSSYVLKCDEAHFWLNGYVNKQKCRIWSEANPQVYVKTPLHPEN
ncbi:hypothetical protein TNCV_31711 [Trichonephila clavipes]|nr:hypothetical protein TNCV_31711 [Trichonephila clavipes]